MQWILEYMMLPGNLRAGAFVVFPFPIGIL